MELIEVLRQALQLEKKGKTFYLDAAERSTDAETKEMYRLLAEDEVKHYQYVQRQYDDLEAGKGWTSIPEMDQVDALETASLDSHGDLIFPPGKEAIEVLPDDASEEDALIFALSVEDKSFTMYRDGSEQAEDTEAKQMFLQLAAAEHTHFNVLMQRYESRYGYPR
jgi:rubrerythrin